MSTYEADSRWSLQTLSQSVRTSSRWMEILGVLLILCGLVSLSSVVASSFATTFVIGGALLVAGLIEIGLTIAYWIRRQAGFNLGIILGCLCVISGILCLAYPAQSLQVLSFILAIYCISTGAARFTLTVSERFPGWGWGVIASMADVFLGILILAWWPGTSLVVLGTLVGIELVVSGTNAITTGMSVRRFLKPFAEPSHASGRPATRFQH